jgi:hypothetical protein
MVSIWQRHKQHLQPQLQEQAQQARRWGNEMLMAAEVELLVATPPTDSPEAGAMTELVEQGS